MAWQLSGQVNVTNNSSLVTGGGTHFTSIQPGSGFRLKGPTNPIYEVLSVTDDTHMTLASNYAGATASAQDYEVLPMSGLSGSTAEASQMLATFLDRYGEIINALGNSDRTIILNKTTDADKASITLQSANTDLWKIGSEGDTNFILYRKSGVTWLPVFTVDKTTGVLTFASGALTSAANPQNHIFNGTMRESRTNGSSTVDVNGTTTEVVDNFFLTTGGGGVVRAQQVAGPSLAGSPFMEKLTVQTADGSVAAGDVYRFEYRINGTDISDLLWGTAAAKSLTVQFAATISLAGTYCLSARNAAGTRSYVREFVVTAPQAGVQTLYTVTFPGDTAGAWLNTDADSIVLAWDLGSGSTFNATVNTWSGGLFTRTVNQFNMIGNAAATMQLGDVAAYSGTTAPTYEVPLFSRERRLMGDWTKPISIAASALMALAVGLTTANPALQVDTTPASAVTGIKITPAASGSGIDVAARSSGANEPITFNAKGSGSITFGNVSTGAIQFSRNAVPTASDGAALGTTALMWSDLFLAAGGVLNFNAGNYTVTHSAGLLTFSGGATLAGTLTAPSPTFTGTVTAAAITLSGLLTAPSPTFTGTITASAATFGGTITASAATFGGTITAQTSLVAQGGSSLDRIIVSYEVAAPTANVGYARVQADGTGNLIFTSRSNNASGIDMYTCTNGSTLTKQLSISSVGVVSVLATTASSTSATGALIVAGGVGIAGGVNIAGALGVGVSSGTYGGGVTHNITTSFSAFSLAVINNHGSANDAGMTIGAGATSNTDASTTMIDFRPPALGAICGSITRNGTLAVAYNISSDVRGKPNRERLDLSVAREVIDALKIWDFDKDGNAIRGIGWIAQEAYAVRKSFAMRPTNPGNDNDPLPKDPTKWWQAEKAAPVPYLVANVQLINLRQDETDDRLDVIERYLKLGPHQKLAA